MLPAVARLRRREDFTATLRRGRHAGRGTVALALLRSGPGVDRLAAANSGAQPDGALVGFAVGRGVGGAVTRNRTVRRLRHLMRERLDRLPPGSKLVVRALPAAATADHRTIGRDLDSALTRLGVPR